MFWQMIPTMKHGRKSIELLKLLLNLEVSDVKHSNRQSFEQYLKSSAAKKEFSPIYFVLSKDGFERKSIVDLILSQLVPELENRELGVKVFDGEECSFGHFFAELGSVSLFSKKQVIVFNHADKPAKEEALLLENYFARPNPDIFLILTAGSLSHSSNFYKKGEKAGVVFEPVEEKAWEKEKSLTAWIQAKAASAGVSMNPQACQFLLKHVGNDQATLHQEMEKLFCYIGERREITVADISALCVGISQDTIWQLGEAIFNLDTGNAMRICKSLLQGDSAFLSLLRQIRFQFQTEYQVCSILHSGGSSADVSRAFPYMRGQILERHTQMASVYGMERFKRGIIQIDETELKAKNSGIDNEFLAELLIIQLTK